MTQGDLLGDGASPAAVGRRRNVRIGLCSWSDPSLIRSKAFYPRGAGTPEGRLRYYAQHFPVVEVDSSFYAMPDPANAVKWVERTPANFRFRRAKRVLVKVIVDNEFQTGWAWIGLAIALTIMLTALIRVRFRWGTRHPRPDEPERVSPASAPPSGSSS